MIKVVGSGPDWMRQAGRLCVWERGYKGIIRVYIYIYIYIHTYIYICDQYCQIFPTIIWVSSGYSDHRNNNGEFPNRFFPVGSCPLFQRCRWWMITLCPEKIMPHRPSTQCPSQFDSGAPESQATLAGATGSCGLFESLGIPSGLGPWVLMCDGLMRMMRC